MSVHRSIENDNVPDAELVVDSAAESLFQEGLSFWEGQGVQQNYMLAAMRFHQAAKAGHVPALGRLGSCYLKGIGFSTNPEQGVDCLERAAAARDADAQAELATCYEHGNGVDQDYSAAARWYRAAAVIRTPRMLCWAWDILCAEVRVLPPILSKPQRSGIVLRNWARTGHPLTWAFNLNSKAIGLPQFNGIVSRRNGA